ATLGDVLMHQFRTAIAFALLVLGPTLTAAQEAAPQRTHDITLDDYFTQADLFSCVISPDGAFVAYTEGRWQKSTDDRKAELWVVDCKSRATRKLTFDRAGDRSPQWAPDNRTIYFLGNRKREGEKQPPYNGKAQVWRISHDGGEPLAVTRLDEGVVAFALARDGRSLYYTTQTEVIDGEWASLRQQFKKVEYGHGVNHFSPVGKLDLESWRAEKLIDERRVIKEFAVSRDGKRIAMITTPDDTVVSFEGRSRVDVFDTKTGKSTPLPDKAYRAD